MRHFIDGIRRSAEVGHWHSAFAMALMMPEICGRIDHPALPPHARYVRWFDAWFRDDAPDGPAAGARLSGEACHALYCGYLSRADEAGAWGSLAAGGPAARVRLVPSPPRRQEARPDRGPVLRRGAGMGPAQLRVDLFALRMADAVERWASDVGPWSEPGRRMASLLTISDGA